MISVRQVLMGLGVAFTAYLASRGIWGALTIAPEPLVMYASLGLYLGTTWLCIFWEPRKASARPSAAGDGEKVLAVGSATQMRLPGWITALALATAIIIPTATAIGVGPEFRTASFATWYLGGIGALMVIVMVRRRPIVAWMGIAALSLASMTWMGPLVALSLGLVGSIMWVAAAQFTIWSMDRATRDTDELAQLQRAASAWQASQSGRQRERRIQVQRALSVAGPVLTRTVASGGMLNDAERLEARLVEGHLRDEMRGPRLLDDSVRAELDNARRRGANVTVLDEGGLDGLDEGSLAIIRTELAETVRQSGSDRLYIRTSPDARVAVTVVGRSGSGQGLSEEDAVDLWREITHPDAR